MPLVGLLTERVFLSIVISGSSCIEGKVVSVYWNCRSLSKNKAEFAVVKLLMLHRVAKSPIANIAVLHLLCRPTSEIEVYPIREQVRPRQVEGYESCYKSFWLTPNCANDSAHCFQKTVKLCAEVAITAATAR